MLFLPLMPYTVKKTLERIVETQNHYVVKLKANQPKLLAAARQTVENSRAIDSHYQEEKSRGRLEIRETFLYQRQENMVAGWESIKRIVYVRRTFLSKRKLRQTESYYISDLEENKAQYLGEGIRSHWGIENKLHYVKDVVMREDAECTKHKDAASNLALFRDFAFNILKSENRSIKYACEMFENYSVKDLIGKLLRT